MTTGTALREKVSQKAQTVQKGHDPAATIKSWIEANKAEMARALPRHMDVDRLTRIALTTIRTTPKLLECKPASLVAACMQAAQLGLEPGLIGQCYLIPFGQECTFIIGYRGMIDLARRSGNVQTITAHEVYENDLFELEYGLDEHLKHIPWHVRDDEEFAEPGRFRGAYMVAKFHDGGWFCHYMPAAEIDAHRRRSKASSNGPWVTDYVEMAKKTVVRAAWKWLPISVEDMRRVEAADETVKLAVAPDMADVVDSSATITPEDDGMAAQGAEAPIDGWASEKEARATQATMETPF